MGGSEAVGGGGAGEGKEERAFSLEEVRDEDLFLIPDDDWALKPLSLEGLVRLLQMLDMLFEEADDLWGALEGIDEETLAGFISLLIRRPISFARENWRFALALGPIGAFWSSPDFRYLTSPREEKGERDEAEKPTPWLTQIIERLSRERGWTAEYILALPFLAVLKMLAQMDEREWDGRNEMIAMVERGVARAIAQALGKGDSLPDLPSFQETKRKMKEAEAIKEKGRRFFEAAIR